MTALHWALEVPAPDPEPWRPPERRAPEVPEVIAPALTRRQRQVAYLLIRGVTTDAAIARELFLSDATAQQHVDAIRLALAAKNRTHAVALLLRAAAVKSPEWMIEHSGEWVIPLEAHTS